MFSARSRKRSRSWSKVFCFDALSSREPVPTSLENAMSKPALAALEAFQVFEALALIAGAAEIELLDVLVIAELVGRAVEHDLALLHDVAMARHRQRRARVLLDQQDGD